MNTQTTRLSITDGYKVDDTTYGCRCRSPGGGPSYPRGGSGAGFCTAMSSRVTSTAGSIPLFTATSRMLRVKRVPCVLIMMSVGCQEVTWRGTGLTQNA